VKFSPIYISILILTLFAPITAVAQEDNSKITVIFIRDFSASDYYTLMNADEKTRVFSIVEACIPTGFLAIRFPENYTRTEAQNFTQTMLLDVISKMGTFTEYSLEDMRNSCASYRIEHSDD
jgi:hypothetical protein